MQDMNYRTATPEAWKQALAHVEKMRSGNQDITFAVRSSDTSVGFAGAAGHREGRVCCLNTTEEGNQFQLDAALSSRGSDHPLFTSAVASASA